jgi:hypothetical protein
MLRLSPAPRLSAGSFGGFLEPAQPLMAMGKPSAHTSLQSPSLLSGPACDRIDSTMADSHRFSGKTTMLQW